MQERLRLLLTRRNDGLLTELEARELEEFAHVEHLMMLLRTGMLAPFVL